MKKTRMPWRHDKCDWEMERRYYLPTLGDACLGYLNERWVAEVKDYLKAAMTHLHL